MTVRSFDWRDLPALHRYRHDSTFLDSALVLTRGPLVIPGALLSYLAPSSGILTAVCNGNDAGPNSLIGQVMHLSGSQYAHLTFLAPTVALESPGLLSLLEYMSTELGEREALRMLADVEEHSPAFEAMRRAGFATYTRQRIWQITSQYEGEIQPGEWCTATGRDMIAIRSLYNNLVPGLVQQAEPFTARRPQGLVFRRGDDLLAYMELKYGPRGIWAQPFVHPDAEGVANSFPQFLRSLPYRRSRPVYVCVRSYQSWLEPALEDLGAEAGPRQAVMVKHMAIAQKAVRMFALPALEGGHPEISAPIVRSENSGINGTTKNYG